MNRLKNKGYTKSHFHPSSLVFPSSLYLSPICFILISLLCIFPEFLYVITSTYKYVSYFLFALFCAMCYAFIIQYSLETFSYYYVESFYTLLKKQCLVYMDISLLISVVLLMDTRLFENLLFRHAAVSFRNVCLYCSRINS